MVLELAGTCRWHQETNRRLDRWLVAVWAALSASVAFAVEPARLFLDSFGLSSSAGITWFGRVVPPPGTTSAAALFKTDPLERHITHRKPMCSCSEVLPPVAHGIQSPIPSHARKEYKAATCTAAPAAKPDSEPLLRS